MRFYIVEKYLREPANAKSSRGQFRNNFAVKLFFVTQNQDLKIKTSSCGRVQLSAPKSYTSPPMFHIKAWASSCSLRSSSTEAYTLLSACPQRRLQGLNTPTANVMGKRRALGTNDTIAKYHAPCPHRIIDGESNYSSNQIGHLYSPTCFSLD